MAATSLVHILVDEQVKAHATKVLIATGLSVSDAVRIFLTRVAVEKRCHSRSNRGVYQALMHRRVVDARGDQPAMRGSFNVIMRIVSSLIGIAMILMGGVWILQGLNLAFRVGFMVGDYHWTIYGAMLALIGVGEVIWSNTRQR